MCRRSLCRPRSGRGRGGGGGGVGGGSDVAGRGNVVGGGGASGGGDVSNHRRQLARLRLAVQHAQTETWQPHHH